MRQFFMRRPLRAMLLIFRCAAFFAMFRLMLHYAAFIEAFADVADYYAAAFRQLFSAISPDCDVSAA